MIEPGHGRSRGTVGYSNRVAVSLVIPGSGDGELNQRRPLDPPGKDVFGLGRLVAPALGEDSVQHLRSLILVGDLFRLGRDVCGQAALEMDRELGIDFHVRQPVTSAAGLTRDVVAPVQVMEVDLDPVLRSAPRSERRDINDAAAVKSTFDCDIHTALNRGERPRIPRLPRRPSESTEPDWPTTRM